MKSAREFAVALIDAIHAFNKGPFQHPESLVDRLEGMVIEYGEERWNEGFGDGIVSGYEEA